MVHSLASPAAAAAAAAVTAATASANTTKAKTKKKSILRFQRVVSASHDQQSLKLNLVVPSRRSFTLGLAGAFLGLSTLDTEESGSAIAAARRPPPPPPVEKKDPNVSGALAKVLASKKRKEAMKDAMAKLREKGKSINEPAN